MKPRIYVESFVISYAAARKSASALTAFRQEITHRWWDKATRMFALETSAGDPSAAKND